MSPSRTRPSRLAFASALCLGSAAAHSVDDGALLPERFRGGRLWRTVGPPRSSAQPSIPQFLEVPLDHENGAGAKWQLKYYIFKDHYAAGGPLVLNMPGEGPTTRCHGNPMTAALRALVVCPEHRFFGTSVPLNDSSSQNFRYLTVEQNLQDVVAVVRHIRQEHPDITGVVAYGGSYPAASASWIRRKFPDVVDAAIAQSPPLIAKVAFPEYDVSNLVALSSPDARCAQVAAGTAEALGRLLDEPSSRERLMRLFKAEWHIKAPLGDVDFMYGLGDSVAGAVQYGQKGKLCESMVPLFAHQKTLRDWDYAENFANYTLGTWGDSYFAQCYYNSTCMRDSTHGPTASDARSWYWIKCTQLGYLQSAPQNGLTTRPRKLTVERLLEQCRFIFGEKVSYITEEKVKAFNDAYGGGSDLGATHIFETDYSDDPWKMASTVEAVQRTAWPLQNFEHAFLLLTCDGCGHCGANVPEPKMKLVYEQFVAALTTWGIVVPDAPVGVQGKALVSPTLRNRLGQNTGGATAALAGLAALSCTLLAVSALRTYQPGAAVFERCADGSDHELGLQLVSTN